VTARKHAEESLRASEDKYRRLVELAPVFISFAVQGRIVYMNPAGVRMLGAEQPDQIVGKYVADIVPPDDRERAVSGIRRILASQSPLLDQERRLMRLDGQSMDVLLTIMPFMYQGQPAIQMVGYDVTARKRYERSLQQSEARYRTFFESTIEGILVVAEDGLVLANRACARILGYTDPQTLVGLKLQDVAAPELCDRLCRAQVMPQPAEVWTDIERSQGKMLRADGTVVDVLVYCTPLVYAEQSGALLFFHDITLQLENERRLQAIHEIGRSAIASLQFDQIFWV
jgi:PAS domain S-box-containing protein